MPKKKQPAKSDFLAINDVAELLLVTDRTVRNWLRDKGMPSTSDERGRRFVWAEVLPWYVKLRADEDGNARKRTFFESAEDTPEDDKFRVERIRVELLRKTGAEAELRKTIAEADLKELELGERRRQVVAVEDVSRVMQDTAKNLQVEILGWPTLMIGRIYGMRDRNQLFALLTSSARDLCTRLAGVGTQAPGA
jgi:phage terminase Nu1 subunit (DNA packaging protein)